MGGFVVDWFVWVFYISIMNFEVDVLDYVVDFWWWFFGGCRSLECFNWIREMFGLTFIWRMIQFCIILYYIAVDWFLWSFDISTFNFEVDVLKYVFLQKIDFWWPTDSESVIRLISSNVWFDVRLMDYQSLKVGFKCMIDVWETLLWADLCGVLLCRWWILK